MKLESWHFQPTEPRRKLLYKYNTFYGMMVNKFRIIMLKVGIIRYLLKGLKIMEIFRTVLTLATTLCFCLFIIISMRKINTLYALCGLLSQELNPLLRTFFDEIMRKQRRLTSKEIHDISQKLIESNYKKMRGQILESLNDETDIEKKMESHRILNMVDELYSTASLISPDSSAEYMQQISREMQKIIDNWRSR